MRKKLPVLQRRAIRCVKNCQLWAIQLKKEDIEFQSRPCPKMRSPPNEVALVVKKFKKDLNVDNI